MLTLTTLKSGWRPWLILKKNSARWPWTNYGRVILSWLAVWVLSTDWFCHKLEVWDFFRRLGEAAAPWGGECGPCPNFTSYTLPFALKLRKITENLSQGKRKALDWSTPNAIRLVDLANVGDGLDWPAAPAALSFRVRRQGQPSVSVSICRVAVLGGSPRHLNLSQSCSQGSDVVGKQRNTKILVYLHVTCVPAGTSNKTKTLGL